TPGRPETRRRHFRVQRSIEPPARQCLQCVIHLRSRHVGPRSNLASLQLQIRLITVHRPLREQAQQHEIRRCQLYSPRSACASSAILRKSLCPRRLCVFPCLHFFPVLRFVLQYHHSHCSAGSRGFFACATAAQKVSSTQGSCRRPVRRFSFAYKFSGLCNASCVTLRILSSSKSRSIAGPIEIKSPNCCPPILARFFWLSVPALTKKSP